MAKSVKIWPFDLAPRTNQSFWDIDIWVILKASIASKIMSRIKKNLVKHFWEIFEKLNLYAQNEVKWGPRAKVKFFPKIHLSHFWVFMMTKQHAKYQKN